MEKDNSGFRKHVTTDKGKLPVDNIPNRFVKTIMEKGYCDMFSVLMAGQNVETILSKYDLTLSDIKELNPQLDLHKPQEDDTPLCVVGTVTSNSKNGIRSAEPVKSKKGKRSKKLTKYSTKPGDNCLGIMKRANVDMLTFAELNPGLDCMSLVDTVAVVYLPKDTIVKNKESKDWPPKALNQDCVVGMWSNWTVCDSNNIQTRDRVIYREASGSGNPCTGQVETRPCQNGRLLLDKEAINGMNKESIDDTHDGRQLQLSYCPGELYDGCSLPSGIQYYHLFVPACNVHDICYSCNNHPAWTDYGYYADKAWCDNGFHGKMYAQCNWKWSGWWQGLDLTYCYTMADVYLTGVAIGGNDGYDVPVGSKPQFASDGCYWWPWDEYLNNANGAGFYPPNAADSCGCYGTSCEYC